MVNSIRRSQNVKTEQTVFKLSIRMFLQSLVEKLKFKFKNIMID